MDSPFVKANLVQRHPISFAGTGDETATVSFVPQRESVTPADKSQHSWNFCHKSRWHLSGGNENTGYDYDQGLLNCIFVMDTYQRDSTRVKVQLNGPLINWLVDKAGHGLKIKVRVSHFGHADLTASGLANKKTVDFFTSTEEMRPRYSLNRESNHPIYEGSFSQTPRVWLIDSTGKWSKHHEYHVMMDIEMFGEVKRGIVQQSQLKKWADPWVQVKNDEINEQYINKENTDMEITAANGEKFPCHKMIVIGKSDKLRRKLAETSDGRSQMQTLILEISAASVKAFLACRYAVNAEESLQDCAACIDVLKITEEYELLRTQENVKNILMTKFDCFEAGHCLQLYCFAGDNPNHKDLKEKALRAMKMKYQELVLSAEFDQLLRQDRRMTKEVLTALESMSAVLTEAKYLPD